MNMFDGSAQLGVTNRPPENVQTLVEVCRWQADQRGDQAAFTHLTDDGQRELSVTFAELDRRLRAVAATLQMHGRRGDRVLIVQQPGLDYVVSLFGCMYAGMVAVPVYPPDVFRLRQTLPRLQAITSEADARMMLSSREVLGDRVGPMWELCKDAAIATDEIDLATATEFKPVETTGRDLALLQYTSGSTGTPRGVALTHRNVLANAEQGFYAFDVPDAVCVFWLPPYHDLGLIGGMLIPMFGGRHSVLMSPIAFLQEPIRWFRAITKFRGTTTASPNFGYEWCLRKISLDQCEGIDLSSLKLAAVGAEPVRAGTLRRFAERFSALGFDPAAYTPGYGMAEATLAVTNKPLGTQPVVRGFDRQAIYTSPARAVPRAMIDGQGGGADDQGGGAVASDMDHSGPESPISDEHPSESSPVSLVSSGRPVRWCEVRIVDPETRGEKPDGMVGEIWVRSPSVARGYWRRPEESASIFAVKMTQEIYPERRYEFDLRHQPLTDDGYLRTGDLGFFLDGELFVSGRLKEQIIIAGRNFFPHDIEAAIQASHEAFKVDGGIAFSVDDGEAERLVVVHEVLRPKRFDLAELTEHVLHVVMDEFGVVPSDIVLVSAASLPKTSSGKLRRLACREQFLQDELQVMHRWSSAEDLGEQVARRDADEYHEELPREWTATQRQVAQLWCDVLGLEGTYPSQHFLSAGGHSLMATQLIARIQERLDAPVQLTDLFNYPTLEEFANRVVRLTVNDRERKTTHEPVVVERGQLLPLSNAQTSFWLLDQMGRTDAFLHLGLTLRLRGTIDVERLAKATADLVKRHPGLSAAFVTDSSGKPKQQFRAGAGVSLETFDACTADGTTDHAALHAWRGRLTHEGWNVQEPPLLRVGLASVGPQELELVLAAHHLVCDGWSLGVVARDLAALYATGEIADATETQQRAFSHWVSSVLRHAAGPARGDAAWAEAMGYWGQRLSGAPEDSRLHLPARSDAAAGEQGSLVVRRRMSAVVTRRLQQFAGEAGVTPFALLITLWHQVLRSYRGSGDLVLGVPVANRTHSEEEGVVGCFINTVPFRLDFLAATQAWTRASLRRSVTLTHEAWLSDLKHSIVSLDTIMDLMDLERASNRMPLIQHLVLHQPHLMRATDFGDARVIDYETDYSSLSAYETAFLVEQHAEQLELAVVHDPVRIDPTVASFMLDSVAEMLDGIVRAEPATSVGLLTGHDPETTKRALADQESRVLLGSNVSRGERALVDQWTRGRSVEGRAPNFLERFARQIQATPEATGLETADGVWTYAQLDQRSAEIAAALRGRGVEAGQLVGVALPRTADMLATLIGIWKLGAAYLPLDLSHPTQRLRQVLTDAQPACVVMAGGEDAGELRVGGPNANSIAQTQWVSLSDIPTCANDVDDACVDAAFGNEFLAEHCRVNESEIAYVMYTSGSTGLPKGVEVEHKSVANLLRSFAKEPGFSSGERLLASTTISFDISVLELFLPLATGGTVVMAPQSLSDDAEAVLGFLNNHSVDVIQGTPSSLRMLMTLGWTPTTGMRIWCGGEPLTRDLAERLLNADVVLWNVYGPTETTVWSLIAKVTREQLDPISIGRPIDQTNAHILDAQGAHVPVGVTGELWIGGVGVARGYRGNEKLTQERFQCRAVQWPGETERWEGLYRTGDLVRLRTDGCLEFVGRADRQVKLRGHRVELGEIEAALQSVDGVSAAAVRLVSQAAGDPRLVAYYCVADDRSLPAEELQRQAAERLPTAMIPEVFVGLAELPHTPAGKVDYRALPTDSCVLDSHVVKDNAVGSVAPRNEIERFIADVWSEVLGVASIGAHDHFFRLGGHSLKAAQVFARLRQHFGAAIELKDLYRYPTVAELAASLGEVQVPIAPASFEVQNGAEVGEESLVAPTDSDTDESDTPLSFAEQRLWFVDQLEPNHPFYNLPLAARISGPLDHGLLGRALNECVARHETLRSAYRMRDGEPCREVAEAVNVRLASVDLREAATGLDTNDEAGDATNPPVETQLHAAMEAESRRPFDLAHPPLIRVTVYQIDNEEFVVLLVMHHIISDGWSMAVMLGELAEVYRAFQAGETPQLSPLRLTYSAYARQQREQLTDTRLAASQAFWAEALEGCNETLDLPTDYERPAVQDFEGATCRLSLDQETTRRVHALAEATGTTPFMVLLTAYAILLARYANTRDLNIGTAIANRPDADLESLIGFFVGTLVLRARLEGVPSFETALEQMRETTIAAFGHADVPFERLVEQLAHSRDRSHSPLFQAAFIFQNTPRDFRTAPNLSIEPMLIDNGTAKYDLTLFLWEQQERLEGYFEYRTSLFREASIERMGASFETLLVAVLDDPQASLESLELVSEAEADRILKRAIGPIKEVPEPRVLHGLLERQVAERPDHIALIDRELQWTYRELAAEVERLASGLQSFGVGNSCPTLLYLPRSANQLAAELACSRCGSPFVPIDTNFPPERVTQIIQQTRPRVVVCQREDQEELQNKLLAEGQSEVGCVTVEALQAAAEGHTWSEVAVDPHDACYVIFTSGSTGQPKGVVIEHYSYCNFMEATGDSLEITPEDRGVHLLSPSFDGALSATYPTLNRGATLVIAEPADVQDPARLTSLLQRHHVTYATLTPPVLSQLDPEQLPELERVLSGGAILAGPLAQTWLEKHRLFNGYGPTECTVGTAIQEVPRGRFRVAPIGRPLQNMRMYILDERQRPVPDGVPGEVYLAGDCVGRGYWENPEQTARCFVPDPFQQAAAGEPIPRMYRTGDLGVWNSDGLIEIIGRSDEQVKLRGYRIEPGEIAAAMERLPEVRTAAVVAFGDDDDSGKRLVGYFVPEAGTCNEHADTDTGSADQHIDNWLALFDQSHQHGGVTLAPEDDFAGWQSVISGEAIERDLMREWADASAERIRSFQPQHILEVGCGTGLILLRLGEEFASYTGIDIMPSAIQQLRQTLSKRPQIQERVELHVGRADQLQQLPLRQFDTIVLNSVVQYFPSRKYLVDVLQQLSAYLLPGGRIFIGDVRDLRLHGAFAAEVELARMGSEALTVEKFRRRLESRMDHDEELLLDPRMFEALGEYLPRWAGTRVTLKRGSEANELNRYRYDVTLHFDELQDEVGLQAPYPADERLERNGEPQRSWWLWKTLLSSAAEEALDAVVRRVDAALASSGNIEDIATACAGQEDGFDWEAAQFARNLPESWSNHPLERRQSLQLINRIRDRLRSELPDYMVPSAFVRMDTLPKTVQGKLDKSALPPPPVSRPEWAGHCRPARDAYESLLVEVWEELLEIDPVGIDDDFFELGGHSMLAVRMVAEVEKRSGTNIPLAALFRKPTIEHLADLLRNPAKSGPAAALIPLNREGDGTPLFCIHPAGGTVFCYRELAEHLRGVRPVYGLQARGVDGRAEPHQTLSEMAKYYAEAIQQVCSRGPCQLLGWSIGGNIAFEVARQLQAAGVEVESLNLLDSGLLQSEGELAEADFLPLIAALFPGDEHLPLEELRKLAKEEQLEYFVRQASKAGIVPIDNELLGMQIFSVFQANVKAVHEYEPQPYAGPMRLVRPHDQSRTGELFDDPVLGWRPLVTAIDLQTIPGDHAGMLQGDAVREIAKLLG